MRTARLFNLIFWNSKPEKETSLPDPIGLDRLRDNLADKLVPCLTGRSRYPEEVFWCLVLLSWSNAPSYRERVERFLRYEWRLKLVWAKYRNHRIASKIGCPPKFSGSRGAAEQISEVPDAYYMPGKYRPLLANQRSQGMLGSYLKVLTKLSLVNKDLSLTAIGAKCCFGAEEEKIPATRQEWNPWKEVFTKAYHGYPGFKRSLSLGLRKNMPELAAGLAAVKWPQTPAWDKAARHMGKQQALSSFAAKYCRWADKVRAYFNDLADGGTGHLNAGTLSIPSELFQQSEELQKEWRWIANCTANKKLLSRKGIAKRHVAVMKSRGYGPGDYWLCWDDEKNNLIPFPENIAKTATHDGHDCRWGNAIRLMKGSNGR